MGKSMKFFDDMGRKTCQLIPIFPIFCVIHENQKKLSRYKGYQSDGIITKKKKMFLN